MVNPGSQMITDFDSLMRSYGERAGEVVFLQVGANDGRQGDPLYPLVRELGWRGVLVEPQADVFAQLLVNYGDQPGLRFVNAAVDRRDGARDLFKIAFSKRRWATGLASLVEDHLREHIRNGYVARSVGCEADAMPADEQAWIATERVRTVSFETLLAEHDLRELDLLNIDAEGYDDQLLEMFDFERLRPSVVQFERHAIGKRRLERAVARLKRYDYELFAEGINMVCVRLDVVIALKRRFDPRLLVSLI